MIGEPIRDPQMNFYEKNLEICKFFGKREEAGEKKDESRVGSDLGVYSFCARGEG
jgi:hypothetical protein